MNDKIKYYEKFVSSFPKLTIKEFESLLNNHTIDNKNRFLEGFMHYILRMSKKLYRLNIEYFNAYYDFEDLFNDGVILASEMFLAKKFYFKNFGTFEKYYFTIFTSKLLNTYFIKVGPPAWLRVKEILNYKMQNISNDEICNLTGFSKRVVDNVRTCEYLIDTESEQECFEDMVIDKIIKESIVRKVTMIMHELPFDEEELISVLYGINGREIMGERTLAQNYYVSRQWINFKRNKVLKKIKNENENLKEYLK